MRSRSVLYSKGIYENDLRDMLFYRRVRPKFFASEPASVTFCYTLFTFVWLVTSPWRWKLSLYVGLVGVGLYAMPGPTLLLMLVLILPYLLFLDSRGRPAGRLRASWSAIVAALFLVALSCWPRPCFPRASRGHSGNDPSFFYRVQGPALAGLESCGRLSVHRGRTHRRALHRARSHQSLSALARSTRRTGTSCRRRQSC